MVSPHPYFDNTSISPLLEFLGIGVSTYLLLLPSTIIFSFGSTLHSFKEESLPGPKSNFILFTPISFGMVLKGLICAHFMGLAVMGHMCPPSPFDPSSWALIPIKSLFHFLCTVKQPALQMPYSFQTSNLPFFPPDPQSR